jgi:hypothetical protein
MDFRQMKWHWSLLAGLLVFSGLWWGNSWLRARMVYTPVEQGLAACTAVERVAVEEGANGLILKVEPKADVDLETAYNQVLSTAERTAHDQPYQIQVVDERSPELEKLYREQIAFILHEAVATGRYSGLPQQVAAAAEAQGAKSLVTIDADRLYLTLSKEQKRLYAVVERHPAEAKQKQKQTAEANGGEGW